jgi:hypothetical protein
LPNKKKRKLVFLRGKNANVSRETFLKDTKKAFQCFT